jgi:hypothetical protein
VYGDRLCSGMLLVERAGIRVVYGDRLCSGMILDEGAG